MITAEWCDWLPLPAARARSEDPEPPVCADRIGCHGFSDSVPVRAPVSVLRGVSKGVEVLLAPREADALPHQLTLLRRDCRSAQFVVGLARLSSRSSSSAARNEHAIDLPFSVSPLFRADLRADLRLQGWLGPWLAEPTSR